nr:uncharacterized protein LOC104230873 [Ipomoea batatas]
MPLPASWLSMPSCQNTWMRSPTAAAGEEAVALAEAMESVQVNPKLCTIYKHLLWLPSAAGAAIISPTAITTWSESEALLLLLSGGDSALSLNCAAAASSLTLSAMFSTQTTISVRIEATAATGITCSRSTSSQRLELRSSLRFLAAVLELAMCLLAEEGWFMFLTDDASSCRALPDSMLIFVHVPFIILLISPGPYRANKNGDNDTNRSSNGYGGKPLVSQLQDFISSETRNGNQAECEDEDEQSIVISGLHCWEKSYEG